MNDLNEFIAGIRVLNVPRAEDLPYKDSPPIQFVYESSGVLTAGVYTWADVPAPLTPNRPILPNALYYFRSLTLSADITSQDYTAALSLPLLGTLPQTPKFQLYPISDSVSPLFREPIIMNQFFEQFDYRLFWKSQQGQGELDNDQLLATFQGSINQTPSLVGLGSITLKAVISAQEIVDSNYINLFERGFPGAIKK